MGEGEQSNMAVSPPGRGVHSGWGLPQWEGMR